MKTIDQATWPRKSLYDYFRSLPSPHFSLTAEVDVTALITRAKPLGVAQFNGCLYAVMTACNAIPELRQRLQGEQVVEYATVHPAPTVPIEGDRFAFCAFDHHTDWTAFNAACTTAIEQGKRQSELKDDSETRFDLIFTTCLPWVAFTSMHHPVQGPHDSFPRIAWGRFTERRGTWRMPVNIQVHHALADGLHVSRFFQYVQEALEMFG